MQESDLARLHSDAIKYDPFISRALGPKAEVCNCPCRYWQFGTTRGLRTRDDM